MSETDAVSTAQKYKQAARDLWVAFVANDRERLRELLAPDARWVHNGAIDLSGTYEGVDAIVDKFVAGAHPLFVPGTLKITVTSVLCEGETVAMEFESTGVSAATGLDYHSPYGLFLEFREGLIVEAREYVDTTHSIEVLYAK